jgi:DNA-binding NtrC family response regulator
VESIKKGAFDYIEKPLDLNRLLITIRNAMDKSNLVTETKNLKRKVSKKYEMIGESQAIKNVIEMADRVAATDARVLITGSNGTGKELVARRIHERSHRSAGPFVEVNCAAIPSELIESELFGHEKGAFTSAVKQRIGKFEQANGGTLFLDEIGEMPLDMQVKLLRALQESAITRVGGNKLIPVDVRIIAATNKNLKDEIAKGNFRSELFYRLSVIPIHIPALRERREDIPILIQYFLNLKAIKLNKMVPEISKPLFTELIQYEWPGNIRELENFIEKFVNLDGDLSFETESYSVSSQSLNEAANASNKTVRSLAATEKEAIRAALNAYAQNISQTAKALGISRNALYEKIKRHGI